MRRSLVFCGCLLVAGAIVGSCGDDSEPANPSPTATGGGAGGSAGSGGSPSTTGGSAGTGGATGGSAGGTLAPCLDRPDDLPRPPMNELPCELLPPGFTR
jgi:hypothetical protein